jgi:hypothetical protein
MIHIIIEISDEAAESTSLLVPGERVNLEIIDWGPIIEGKIIEVLKRPVGRGASGTNRHLDQSGGLCSKDKEIST